MTVAAPGSATVSAESSDWPARCAAASAATSTSVSDGA